MTTSKIALVTFALLLSTAQPSIAVKLADHWIESYIAAQRCNVDPKNMYDQSQHGLEFGERDPYGHVTAAERDPNGHLIAAIEWSDEDITTAGRIYNDCVVKSVAARIRNCVQQTSGPNRSNPLCGIQEAKQAPRVAQLVPKFVNELRSAIVSDRKIHQQAVQRAELAKKEEAQRRAFVDEANRYNAKLAQDPA